MKHLPHIDYASEERREILISHQIKIAGELNVTFEFGD